MYILPAAHAFSVFNILVAIVRGNALATVEVSIAYTSRPSSALGSQSPSLGTPNSSDGSHDFSSITATITPPPTSGAAAVSSDPGWTEKPGDLCELEVHGSVRQLGVTSTAVCTATKTIAGPPLSGLSNDCVLWDQSCQGNHTQAVNDFYNDKLYRLQENSCFCDDTLDCSGVADSQNFQDFSKIREWMRSPGCDDDFHEFQRGSADWDYTASNDTMLCCNDCYIGAADVDLYYWPVEGADDSCLSIVGDKVNPPLYGATTGDITYWGCTPATPVSGQTVITTARMTNIGSVTFKQSLFNPWDESPCGPTSLPRVAPLTTAIPGQNLHPRGHSLIVPASAINGSLKIVTTDGFTFTSPTVYANFHSLTGNDWCGMSVFPTKLVAFEPDELSTIAGPLTIGYGEYKSEAGAFSTQQFNFADLPCPPHSVEEQNWYKPEPGEPYRPLIALPSKVRALVPWWSRCEALFFTAFDPARTLAPQEAMGPTPVPELAVVKSKEGAMVGANDGDPGGAAPVAIPTIEQPRNTASPVVEGKTSGDPPDNAGGPGDPKKQQSDAVKHNGDTGNKPEQQDGSQESENHPSKEQEPAHTGSEAPGKKQAGTNFEDPGNEIAHDPKDPEAKGVANVSENLESDPSNEEPSYMDSLNQALKPGSSNQSVEPINSPLPLYQHDAQVDKAPAQNDQPPQITIAGHNINQQASHYQIDDQTLYPGGPPATLSELSNPGPASLTDSPARQQSSSAPVAVIVNSDHSLIFASQIIPLDLPSKSANPQVRAPITVGSFTLTPLPAPTGSGVSFSNPQFQLSLSPGGTAAILTLSPSPSPHNAGGGNSISGTTLELIPLSLSLDESNNLFIGSQEVHQLPLPAFNTAASTTSAAASTAHDLAAAGGSGAAAGAVGPQASATGLARLIMGGFGPPSHATETSATSALPTGVGQGSASTGGGIVAQSGNVTGAGPALPSGSGSSPASGDVVTSTSVLQGKGSAMDGVRVRRCRWMIMGVWLVGLLWV